MFVRTMAVAMLAFTPAFAQEPADWSGGFVGGFVGALRSDGAASLGDYQGALLELDVSNGLFPENIDDADVAGTGGLTFGWNRQSGTLVTGVEIDFALTGSDVQNGFARRDPNPDPIFNGVNTITGYGTELDTLATARLKAGYASGANLFYVTGGLAAGRVRNSFSLELTELGYASDWSTSGTRFGYVVGAGIERRMSGRLSAKVEVLGYDLADATVKASDPVVFPGQTIDYSFDNSGVVARIGLNYGF